MTASKMLHLEVEKISGKVRPVPFFYHVAGDKVIGVSAAVTPAQYNGIDIETYARLATKIGAPFYILERSDADKTVSDSIFVELFDIGEKASTCFENVKLPDFIADILGKRADGNETETFSVGAVDNAFSTALGAEPSPTSRYLFDGYAVIDFETTGFTAAKTDKALEIAIVHTDVFGNIQDSFETVFNPQRDVGAEHIHHLSAEMVAQAPLFSDVAAGLGYLFSNRKLLAHNAKFDHTFAHYEFINAGFDSPLTLSDMVCSMEWSKRYSDPSERFRLLDCLAKYGIENKRPHAAMGDAYATAELLGRLLGDFTDAFPLPMSPVQSSLLFAGGENQLDKFVSREQIEKKLKK